MGNRLIYLDYNATTPVDDLVLEDMLPFFQQKFGNASSNTHAFGWETEEVVSQKRLRMAQLLGVNKGEIYFTSGATEAINIGLIGHARSQKKKHIITCVTEHSAVLQSCNYLEENGFHVTRLKVNNHGLISLKELQNCMTEDTFMLCLMAVNNETGVIQNLNEISEIIKPHGIRLFSDITQAIGKIPINLNNLGIDMAAFSGHKIYGPKGVGCLFISDKTSPISPILFGGSQERGLIPGTLNVPGIVGLSKAVELSFHRMESESNRINTLRNKLESALMNLEICDIQGTQAPRVCNTSSITFHDVPEDNIIRLFPEIAVSQGSACHSVVQKPSHVLKAMGLSDKDSLATLRFSLGAKTNEEDIDYAINHIFQSVEKWKTLSA